MAAAIVPTLMQAQQAPAAAAGPPRRWDYPPSKHPAFEVLWMWLREEQNDYLELRSLLAGASPTELDHVETEPEDDEEDAESIDSIEEIDSIETVGEEMWDRILARWGGWPAQRFEMTGYRLGW